jgi:hypothetical protein
MPEPRRWSEMSERERDAYIAEKIFGHRTVLNTQNLAITEDKDGDIHMHYPRTGYLLADQPSDERGHPLVPHYTTSMDAAWLVVEHLTKLPITIEEPLHSAGPRFAVWFDRACLWANTAQEAAGLICLTALKYVTGEDIEP